MNPSSTDLQSLSPGSITIARHGRPDANRERWLDWRGYEDWWDNEYQPAGLVEGQSAPDALIRAAAESHTVFASSLRRAIETAQPLAVAKGLEVGLERGVRELDAESDHYIPLEELREQDYDAWREAMAGGLYAGVDVESFRAEVVDAFERIIAAHRGRSVAVVCHGGVINAWASHVLGIEELLFFNPYYTSINRFFAASSGERSVATLGETPHLRADVFPDAQDPGGASA